MSSLVAQTLPLVGLPMRVGEGQIIATVTCLCAPANPALLITSVETVVTCAACRSSYVIVRAEFNRRTQTSLRIEVARVALPGQVS